MQSAVKLYADDTKLYRCIRSAHDESIFQSDLDALQHWSDEWLLQFHPQKCVVMTVGDRDSITPNYYMIVDELKEALHQTDCTRDLGVLFDKSLKFQGEISTRVQKANNIVGIIHRSLTYLDESTFSLLFKALMRPHLEYAVTIWYPHHKQDIKSIEDVQRRATKQVDGLRHLSYSDHLRTLKLPTLRFRRLRGDMIEVYKFLHGMYNADHSVFLQIAEYSNTRGHSVSLKLEKKYVRTAMQARVFSNRIVNDWNSLTDHVVTAPNLNTFKNRLD